jgi:hypothetical protein
VLLASALWLHAIFALNVPSSLLSRYSYILRLSSSEAALLLILLTFSFLSGAGPWRTFRSLSYIYFFPFVILWYFLRIFASAVKTLNGWLMSQAPADVRPSLKKKQTTDITVHSASPEKKEIEGKGYKGLIKFLTRPFRKFMILWCVLLLITTHMAIVWLCLIVVLLQLGRKIFLVMKGVFFSDPWLRKYGPLMFAGLQKTLDAIEANSPDNIPEKDAKSWLGQLDLWRKILDFLENQYLMQRWAWIICAVLFFSIYAYFSLLFSFGYYGLTRVCSVTYPWPDALVTSIFIPAYVGDLPKLLAVRILGGIQFTLVVLLGIGTFMNFLQRRLEAVYRTAAAYSDRLDRESIQNKYLFLKEKHIDQKRVVSSETKEMKD